MNESWADIAFGSDDGMLFVDYLESLSESEKLDLILVYTKCDLEKYISDPSLLESDTTIELQLGPMTGEALYAQVVITLGAILAECKNAGQADLASGPHGTKTLRLEATETELRLVADTLANLRSNTDRHYFFELVEDYLEEVVGVMTEIEQSLRAS